MNEASRKVTEEIMHNVGDWTIDYPVGVMRIALWSGNPPEEMEARLDADRPGWWDKMSEDGRRDYTSAYPMTKHKKLDD